MASSVSHADYENEASLDFQGNHADKSKTGGWLAAGLILGTELSQKICLIGISVNLVTYLQGDMHFYSSDSANTVTNCMGSLNLLALFGGFLADAKLGRFLAIVLFSSICTIVSFQDQQVLVLGQIAFGSKWTGLPTRTYKNDYVLGK
ncbi:NRT1/ PTR family 6.4-like protein [Tanacetum coccineum]|uniref:NRT1/ PTR family 6.4-like protein n=1 Tax=Tanacetum coccineum TaxID=301880 RepID=A0ABQ5CX72_9ASTR